MKLAECTKEDMVSAMHKNKLKKADIQSALAKHNLTIATTTDATATKLDTVAKKENFKWSNLLKVAWDRLKATKLGSILTNPWVLATAAIVAATTAIYKWSKADEEALEESKENLEEISSEYESVTSEVESLESQIQSLNDQINDLDPITDDAQIQKLKEERAELEGEVELLRQRQEYLASEEAKAAEDALKKTTTSKYSTEGYNEIQNNPLGTGDMSSEYGRMLGYFISNQGTGDKVTEYEELVLAMEEVNRLEKERQELESQQGQYTNNTKKWNEYKDKIADVDSQIEEIEGHASELALSVQGSYSKLADGEFKDYIGEILFKYYEFSDAVDAASASFATLNKEQQKSALQSKLIASYGDSFVDGFADYIDEKDYEKLYNADFSNIALPEYDHESYEAWAEDCIAYIIEELNKQVEEQSGDIDFSPFVDKISNVESISDSLDKLSKIYQDVQDGGDFDYSSILNNTDFAETFGEYEEEYHNFIKTITDSPDDIEACQKAFPIFYSK